MGAHTGIFVVWLPTLLIAARITRDAKQKDLWKVALSGCPPWMRQALYVLTGYAVLNFLLFMFASNNHPHQLGDPSTAEIRGFSGHWMIFMA
jgi:hypothetical protein